MEESSFLFFFQAEDGIRDTSVTGVQTCALPIYCWQPSGVVVPRSTHGIDYAARLPAMSQHHRKLIAHSVRRRVELLHPAAALALLRSEERRVGKGCSCEMATEPVKDERRGVRLR